MTGWVLSYRAKWKNPVFRNLQEAGVWAWLCDSAAWEDTVVRMGGHMFEIKRGQFVTSLRFVAAGFGLGERATRTLFENMEKAGMIDTRATPQGTIITICNYDEYQTTENTSDTQPQTRPTHRRHTGDTNNETTKQPNNKTNKYSLAKPDDVSPETWRDFEKLRWAKKAPITETVLKAIRREAEGIGWTMEQALQECCERSWQTFKASWIKEEKNGKQPRKTRAQDIAEQAGKLMDEYREAEFGAGGGGVFQ